MNSTPMLLIDCCGFTTMDLMESVGGRSKFRGKFQEANAINKNKRMYPFEVLDSNVSKLQETINERGFYGELDHATDSIIHLANASHLVTKLWWEGNILMGEAEILPTPNGMILKRLMENNCRVGVSSRGVGNGETNNEGVLIISPAFHLCCFDMVADPSTYSAFQKQVNGKHEHFEMAKVSTPTHNYRSIISYFGTNLDMKVEQLKQNIRKK